VNYMSPEQAQGIEVDRRSDLFSVGVLFYELLTGSLPFKRANLPATLYAVVHEAAPPLASLVPGLPGDLQPIIDKALAKTPEARFQDLAELAVALQGLGFSQSGSISIMSAPIPVQPQIKGLAVLYLRNLGGADDEFLSYGITEDLIVDLSRLKGMRVAPMRAILKYKDSDAELEEIAAKLNVTMVLDGSLHKAGERIRISAQLLEVATGSVLWAERWEEAHDNLPQIKRALAGGLGKALQVDSTRIAAAQVGQVETSNPQAYEFYLRGKYAFERKQDSSDIEVALGLYRQALELEPGMLAARAGVAEVLIHKGQFVPAQEELLAAISAARNEQSRSDEARLLRLLAQSYLQQSAWDRAGEVGDQARQLSIAMEDLAGEAAALTILIDLQQRRARFDRALELSARVLEINRSLDDQQQAAAALKNMGTVHLRKGEFPEARRLYGQAREIASRRQDRSLEADCIGNTGLTYFHTGEIDLALKCYQQALEIHGQLGNSGKRALWLNNIAQIHESRGEYRAALDSFQQAARLYRELGDRGKYAHATANVAAMLLIVGEYLKAIDSLHEALAIARELDYPLVSASAYDSLGSAFFYQGDHERARDYFQLALESAQQARLRLNVAHTHFNLAELFWSDKQLTKAREHSEQSLALAEEMGLKDVQVKARALLTAFDATADNCEANLHTLQELEEQARALGDPRVLLAVQRLLVEQLHNAAGPNCRAQAREVLAEALALATRHEIVPEQKWLEALRDQPESGTA
ncbi:MAG: tetratricopeptide repeat protein, partial [bacterium]